MKSKSNFLLSSMFFVLMLSVITQTYAQTIKVCYKSGAGAYTIGGTQRSGAAAKLTNPINFGQFGASPFTFETYNFGNTTITLQAIQEQGCQIFDVGINETASGSGTSVSGYAETELQALYVWTRQSKANVLLAYQGFANFFSSGYTATGTGNVNPNSFTTVGLSIFEGPFGSTNAFNQGGSYQGIFSATPANVCPIIQTANGRVTGVLDPITNDVYLADVGMVDQTGGLTTGSGITSNNDRFFANLYNGLAKIVVNNPDNVCSFFNCSAGTNAPVLSATTISNTCSTSGSVNLNSLVTSSPPSGSTLYWHSALPATAANRINNPTAYVSSGTVYAIYEANDGSCTSPNSAAVTVTFTNCSEATIDCNKTQIFTAPVAGNPGQKTLQVTLNVTTAGCFKPLTVTGSGISLANGASEVCTSTTGTQQLNIPVYYDGTALSTLQFTVGTAGSCTANFSTVAPKKGIVDVWTLDCIPSPGPTLK